jgi:hypothetical protein
VRQPVHDLQLLQHYLVNLVDHVQRWHIHPAALCAWVGGRVGVWMGRGEGGGIKTAAARRAAVWAVGASSSVGCHPMCVQGVSKARQGRSCAAHTRHTAHT